MVMVSHAREFIFLKTRKTAGTSIEMALEPWCRPPGAVVVEQTPALITKEGIVGRRLQRQSKLDRWLRRTDWTNHMTAAAICKALGREKWDRYRKITTVRNPFDLLVSRFHFNQSNRGKTWEGDFAQTRAAFNEAVRTEYADFDFDYPIVHLDGRFLPDHVIRIENLQAGFDAVAAAIAPGEPVPKIPHTKNVGFRRTHATAEYFDKDSIAMVLRNAAWIFRNLDYPETPSDIRPKARPEGA